MANVPYLARGKQNETLRGFCERHYLAAKNDLATVFLERCQQLCEEGRTASVVLPQNWLFLTSYRTFREQLLKRDQWHLMARLGSGAFETISGEVVKAILITISRGNASSDRDGLFGKADPNRLIRGLDVSESRTAAEKAVELLTAEVMSVEQAKQLENPDASISWVRFLEACFGFCSSAMVAGMSDYRHKRHNVSSWLYHIVCPAKYRRIIFDAAGDTGLKAVCLDIAKWYEIAF